MKQNKRFVHKKKLKKNHNFFSKLKLLQIKKSFKLLKKKKFLVYLKMKMIH